ncbi:site-specific integrase [Alistipes sp. OttesenSCG-928-B03]|nr:site-specific integrase [Alistipes sp. OttesenSCG-928-B03]
MESKYLLDKRDTRSDGTIPLKVKIYQDRKNYAYISLKIYLRPDQWDGEKIVNHKEASLLNPRLKFYKLNVAREMLEMDMAGGISIDAAKKRIKHALSGKPAEKPMSFTEYYKEHIDRLQNPGTKRNRTETFVKLNNFSDGKPVQFADINVRWLSDFDRFMSDISVNARSIHMRNIRAVLNDAIDEEIAPEMNPFRRFKIKHEATRKRALTVEQLREFMNYPCEPSQVQYRDIFMLIFYLCGINMVDLANLRRVTPDGYIEYRRAKTGRLYKIKVEPEAQDIIDRYRGKNYLLNILDRYKDYSDYLRRLNKNISEIGPIEYLKTNNTKPKGNRVKSGPDKQKRNGLFPDLSTYWARHSWASIAANLDVPKETIAAALGHGGNSVTDIYIDFNQKKVDEANRKMIDHLLQIGE